jgi:putative peptidoglycan lipid II flippase
VLAPVFYALKDTKTPVITALITFIINLCLSLALMGPLKHGGLALATTLSASCNMLMLIWLLRRKIGSFGGKNILVTAVKSSVASIPMAALVWYLCSLIDWSQAGHKVLKGAVLSGSILSGCVVYLLIAKLLRSAEVLDAIALLRRKLRKV